MKRKTRKISKRERVLRRRRALVVLAFLALSVLAFATFISLLHIGGLRVGYAEAYYQGDTYWANKLYQERQAIGTGSGMLAFLYNLPFMLKLILGVVSGAFTTYVLCLIHALYKANQKPKRSVRAKLYRYHYQTHMKRSW